MEEALYPTQVSAVWTKVGLDVTHMLVERGKGLLVVVQDDLSSWPEAQPLSKGTAEVIANFL